MSTDLCMDDAEPQSFGIQAVVEAMVTESLHRWFLSHLDLSDWFGPGSRHDRAVDEGFCVALDQFLPLLRPGFVEQSSSLAEALAGWVRISRPEWLVDDEHGDLEDPWCELPAQVVEYLVGILVLGFGPKVYTTTMLDQDRLFAHKMAGGF